MLPVRYLSSLKILRRALSVYSDPVLVAGLVLLRLDIPIK